MDVDQIRSRLDGALRDLVRQDRYLLEFDLSERCIASRLALHLQEAFPEQSVDVEYNRQSGTPKTLQLPEPCCNKKNRHGQRCVVPDVVVHTRGEAGPNVLVLELKKVNNSEGTTCDRERINAFRERYKYICGAVILCTTGNEPGAEIDDFQE